MIESERTWPANMGFLSNKTFGEVFAKNKEYVEFSRKHITKATGTFKLWIEFLNKKK